MHARTRNILASLASGHCADTLCSANDGAPPAAGGGGTTPPATGAPAAGAAATPPAPPAITPEQLAAANARAEKTAQEFAEFRKQVESPDFTKALLTKALGLDQKADPQAEHAALKERAAKADANARRAFARAALVDEAVRAGAHPEDVVLRLQDTVEVDLATGAPKDPAALATSVAALLEKYPHYKLPAPAAAAGAGPLPGPRPPPANPGNGPTPPKTEPTTLLEAMTSGWLSPKTTRTA